MMTKKIFWEDPYLSKLDTRIASVNQACVTVEETIFFAFSGGQESDTGTIAGHPVLKAEKTGRKIEYTLPPGHSLKKGDAITMEIDWDRRYRLMRSHFAAELILELMVKKLTGSDKIGAHIAEDKARIDFRWNASIAPLLPGVLSEAMALIEKDIEINSAFSDTVNEKRFWEIFGLARVPCGGTHLKRTGEVGKLRLKRKNIGKGKERVEIYLEP